MRDRPIPLTPEGKRNLEKEMDVLLNVRRPEIAEKIHMAKQDGDVSENAGYDAAREEQAIVEGRINYVEALLKNSILIETNGPTDTIALGTTVTVREAGNSSCETYYIVGPAEADPVDGRISNESPLGKALMGCRVGQTVTITAPDGEMKFKIVGIS